MVDSMFSLKEPVEQGGEYRGQNPRDACSKLSDGDLKKVREGGSLILISDQFRQFKGQVEKCLAWARKRNYSLYLQSKEWKAKRDAVVKRDKGKCVFCGDEAQHVHHLTYERIYNEPLYDLIAVCNDCHKAIHYDK